MQIRPACPAERPAVANVVDGAALAVADDRLEAALATDAVLVAIENGSGGSEDPRLLGALVLDGEEIVAVAVRRRRRGQGIGTALVEAAADRRPRLVAAFDPGIRPFWASLDFEIERAGDGRLRGVRSSPG